MPKYGLEAVLTLRRARAEACARALAEKRSGVATAADALAGAEAAVRDFERNVQELRDQQQQRLERGLERAFDLAQAASVRQAEALERQERERCVQRARECLTEASKAERTATAALERALAEERAIERHRQDWDRARRAEQENQTEEQAQEQWNAGRVGSPRS